MDLLNETSRAKIKYYAQQQNLSADDFVEQLLAEYEASQSLNSKEADLFEIILESLETGVIVTDYQGKFVYVCANAEVVFSYSASEIKSYGNIRNLPFIDITLPQIEDLPWHEEHRMIDKAGQSLSLNIKITKLSDNQVLYEIHNITSQKRLLKEIQAYEQQISTVVNHLPIILFAIDRNGVFTLSEGKALESLGLKRGEAVGQSAFELFSGVSYLQKYHQRVLAGETICSSFNTGDKILDVTYTPARNAQGHITGTMGVAIDHTEFHHTQQALLASEARAVKAEKIAAIGHWDWDILTNDLFWSEGIFHLFSLDHEAISAVSFEIFMDFVHPEDRTKVMDAIDAAIQNQATYDLEHRIILKDGRLRYIHEHGEVMFDQSGQAIRMIGTAQDVTTQQLALNELRETKERLHAQYEAFPIPTFTWQQQADDFVLIGSNQASKIISPQIETIFGKTLHDLYTNEPDIIEDFESCFREKKVLKREMDYTTRTGNWGKRYIIATYAYSAPDIVTVHVEDITQRHQAEIALKEAHDRLEEQVRLRTEELSTTNYALKAERDFANTLIDVAPVIVLILNKQGKIVRYNRYFEALTGIPLAESNGKKWINTFLPKHYQQGVEDLLHKAISGERSVGNINPIVDAKGTEHQIIWYDTLLRDGPDNITGLLAIGLDITDRINIEIALEQSEQRYRTLLKLLPVGIFQSDLNGRATFVNDRLGEISGLSSEMLLGNGWISVLSESERTKIIDSWQDAIKNEKDYVLEHRLGSRQVYTTAKPFYDENGQLLAYLGAVTDITELKRAQEELHIKDLALQSATNGIGIANLDGQVIYVNPAFVQMWQYDSADEIIGTQFARDWGSVDTVRQELHQQGYWSGEMIAKRKNGSQIDFLLNASLVKDTNGQPIALMGSVVDITERKLREKVEREHHLIQLNLRHTAETLATSLEIDEIITSILEGAQLIVPHDYACLTLLEDDKIYWEIASPTPELNLYDLQAIDLASLLILNELTEDNVYLVDNINYDHPDIQLPPALKSAVIIGIDSGMERLGFLILWSQEVGIYGGEKMINYLKIFSEQVSRAIMNNKLYTASQEIARLRERTDIAHNLHDAVSQTLWSANIIAQTLPRIWLTDTDKCQRLLKDLSNIIQFTLAEMRAFLMELKPETVMKSGLLEMLNHLISTIEHAQIRFNFQISQLPDLSVQQQLVIYRITQEALNNIVKHAKADEVTLAIAYSHRELIYKIQDNGQGFESSDVTSLNMGLAMMKERAHQIGAKLEWASQRNIGTTIILTMKL